MLVISLQSLAEEASSTGKYDTGNIRALADLFEPGNLAELKEHAAVWCFLAFHPGGDAAVADYVRAGTLADDSGAGVLVLFTMDEPAPIAVPVGAGAFTRWAELGRGVNPAYRLVRMLFSEGPVPALPGLVVFEDLAKDTGGAYLPLGHLATENEVRIHLREVFSEMAYVAERAKPGRFLDDLGVRWARRGLGYERTNRRPMREWLIEGFRVARQNYGDIVGTIGLLG